MRAAASSMRRIVFARSSGRVFAPLEKLDAAGQQLGVSAERPEPGNAAAEAAADPVGDRVAKHRPEDRPDHHRQKRQGAAFHQRAGGDQPYPARDIALICYAGG